MTFLELKETLLEIGHLNKIKENIVKQREGAKRKQEEQADKMLEQSAKRFKPAEVGDSVMVPIPDVDRGRADFLNLTGVVMEANPRLVFTRLGQNCLPEISLHLA